MTKVKARNARYERVIDRLLSDTEHYERNHFEDLKRLWNGYLADHKRGLAVALFVTVFWSLQPFVFRILGIFLVDDVLMVGSEHLRPAFEVQKPLFVTYTSILFATWAVFIAFTWIRSSIVLGVGQKVVFRFRKQLHEKLQVLHIGFFEKHETGKIMSRVLDDVKVIREWSTSQILELSANIIRFTLGIGILLWLNWRLSILVIISLPFYAFAFVRLRPAIRRTNIAVRRLNSGMYALSAERINGIGVVKAFGQERSEFIMFLHKIHNHIRLSMRIIFYQEFLGLIAGLITALVTGAVVYLGIRQVKDGQMTLGQVIAFINSLPIVFNQIKQLSNVAVVIQAVFVVVGRVFYLLDEPEEVIPGRKKLDDTTGEVCFQNVTFSYPGQDTTAIKDVSFRIKSGKKVAVMGPSGAGKSTLFQLLCRFYDPQRGSIRVGKTELREADTHSLRRHVVMVQQEPVIFSGSVAENIVYGVDDAGPADIMRATRQAELHDFIMTLPVKYETEVGRNGISLSGGQKQRLSLSTALLTDPEILLLDDTTSALDAETEGRIRETLNRVLKGRTSFIITQRIATAKDCDYIIVLENGRVTQAGNHDELKEQPGFYKRIFDQQESL